MNRNKEFVAAWNKMAVLYQEKFMELDIYDESYDAILDSLSKQRPKVLEVGCGPGNITKYLLSKQPDLDILGIDIAPNMIELAIKNNPKARFDVMDIRHLDTIKTKYDAVVCGFCLPYVSHADCKKFIADCYNILNDNGLIYLSFVAGDPDESDFQTNSNGDRLYFYYHSINGLTHLLCENNFGEYKTFKVPYKKTASETEMHIALTAKKISPGNN